MCVRSSPKANRLWHFDLVHLVSSDGIDGCYQSARALAKRISSATVSATQPQAQGESSSGSLAVVGQEATIAEPSGSEAPADSGCDNIASRRTSDEEAAVTLDASSSSSKPAKRKAVSQAKAPQAKKEAKKGGCIDINDFKEAGDMACTGLPGWTIIKAKVVRLAAVADINVANRTWADDVFVGTLTKLFETVRDETYRGLDYNACPLGVRALKILCVFAGAPDCPILGSMNPQDVEIFETRSFKFVEVINSGWPIFGFLHNHVKGIILQEKALTLDPGCVDLETEARSLFSSWSLLQPTIFARFLGNHLGVRAQRLRIPAEPVRNFYQFVASRQCELALASAEIASAMVSLLTDGGKQASSLVSNAEARLRHWWAGWVASEVEKTHKANGMDPTQFMVNLQQHLMIKWPIFGMLQRLQDLIFQEERGAMQSVGIGMDRGHLPRGLLASKSPQFWEKRRQRLATAVLGKAADAHVRREMMLPTIEKAGQHSSFLTWDLGRLNSTGVLSRPPDHYLHSSGVSRGLVIFQSGHEGIDYLREGPLDPYGYASHFTSLGFDVITLCMPLFGFNTYGSVLADDEFDPTLYTSPHELFDYWERNGTSALLSYFILPVLLAIDWAQTSLGHTEFAMAGCSGGGWTTTLAAALDPRISLSIPIPGPLPPQWMDTADWYPLDWEGQMNPHSVYSTCSFLCMTILSSVGGGGARRSVHLMHKNEMYPNPGPNTWEGYEKEFKSFYEDYLPAILAAATAGTLGEKSQGTTKRDAAPTVEGALKDAAPVRLAVTAARQHCGDWHDSAILEVVLNRWHDSKKSGGLDLFHEWPLPCDVRRGSCS